MELTEDNEVMDVDHFWRKYKQRIVPNATEAYMNSFGRIQGVTDPELKDDLKDPVKKTGVFASAMKGEIKEANGKRVKVTVAGIKKCHTNNCQTGPHQKMPKNTITKYGIMFAQSTKLPLTQPLRLWCLKLEEGENTNLQRFKIYNLQLIGCWKWSEIKKTRSMKKRKE